MKVLFIGGTGNISSASSRLAVSKGVDLYLMNRGNRPITIDGATSLVCDISDEQQAAAALADHEWDVVVNWIAFTPAEIERDIRLFAGKTKQYIFISSASAYQKPAGFPFITEGTPLVNPHWEYSRKKAASEDRLMQEHRENGFPFTIVRPSLTYDTVIPVAIGSWDDYTIIDRIKRGKEMIVHGDGTSLWTITHSDDFAKGFVGLLGHQQAIAQSFHITSDEVLTWNQIYEAVAAAAGCEAKMVHIPSDFIAACPGWEWHEGNLLGDKAVSAIFDNSKIKSFVPEFTASIPFAEGIRRTVRWFEEDQSRMRIDDGTNANMDKIITAYKSGLAALKGH